MSGYQALSDTGLVTLLRVGNVDGYTEIYNRYYHLMFVFAYKKLREEELAKDFVQELFIRLWEKREDIQENGNLAQFLYISLRSRMFDFFAHQKVEHKYLDFLKYSFPKYSKEQPDYSIREKQLAGYIEKQVEKLPSKMKMIFLLSRIEHLSHKEIAHKLETSEHNVSKQITNALRILRAKLGVIVLFIFQ